MPSSYCINHRILRWIHRNSAIGNGNPTLKKGQIHGWWGQGPPLKVNEGSFFSRLNLPMKKKYLSPRSLKDRSFTMFYPFMCFSFLILNLHNFTKIRIFHSLLLNQLTNISLKIQKLRCSPFTHFEGYPGGQERHDMSPLLRSHIGSRRSWDKPRRTSQKSARR